MIAALALAAIAASAPDPVVARVDGEPISASLLAAREARLGAGVNASRETVLQGLAEDLLFAREARRRGVERRPPFAAALEAERRRLAGDRLVAKEIATLEPAEAQLREIYHQSQDSLRVKVATFATREEAQASLDRLARGADFAEEARRSVDPRARQTGGDLGLLARAVVEPALAEAAFAAPLGALGGPVALRLGFAVFVVAERHVADESGFAARREELRAYAAGQLRAEAKRHLEQALRARSRAAVDEAFLKTTGPRLEASPEEAAHVLATVGGRPIRYGDVLPDVRALVGGKEGHLSGPQVKAQLAWAAVDRALLEEEAIRRGYGAPAEIGPALEEARIWLAAAELARDVQAEAGEPSAAEIEAWYRAHADDYRLPERRACAHLLVRTRKDAEAARARLARGEPFDAVARDVTLDRESRARGGALGELSRRDAEALAANGEAALSRALRDARPDEPTDPVESRAGWHVLRCGPRLGAAERPLAEVRAEVADRLLAERRQAAVARKRFALREGARIQIERGALEALGRAG